MYQPIDCCEVESEKFVLAFYDIDSHFVPKNTLNRRQVLRCTDYRSVLGTRISILSMHHQRAVGRKGLLNALDVRVASFRRTAGNIAAGVK